MRLTIQPIIQGIKEQVSRMNQTLYGINMDNGLVKEVADMKESQGISKAKMWKFVGIAAGAWVGLMAAFTFVFKVILKW